jgi:hypothetical protein
MPSLQDGGAFMGMLSTGFTRGYYHPAPPGQAPAVRQATCGGAGHLRWGRPPAVRQTLAGGSHGICAGGVSAVGPRFGTASASCCSRGGRKSLCQLPLAGTTIHAEEDAP